MKSSWFSVSCEGSVRAKHSEALTRLPKTSRKRRRSSEGFLILDAGNDIPIGNLERWATVSLPPLITALLNLVQKAWKVSSLCAKLAPPTGKAVPFMNKHRVRMTALFILLPLVLHFSENVSLYHTNPSNRVAFP